jgi:hypothetical protein
MKKILIAVLIIILFPFRRWLYKRSGFIEFEYKTLRGLCRTRAGVLEILAIKNLQKHNGVFTEQ